MYETDVTVLVGFCRASELAPAPAAVHGRPVTTDTT